MIVEREQCTHPVRNVERGPWAWQGLFPRIWKVTTWFFLTPVSAAGEAQ